MFGVLLQKETCEREEQAERGRESGVGEGEEGAREGRKVQESTGDCSSDLTT